MAASQKGLTITVGEDESTVEIGAAKIEVSADGKKVTAYANGVETRASAISSTVPAEGRHIDISKGFNAVVLNGVTIEQEADGHLVITAPGTVFMKSPAANDSEPQVGDRMADGTIYAGISPDTGMKMYATAADASLTMKWKKAMDYAAGLDAHGHQDWRVPSKGELNLLWENRDKGALKGTFNVTGCSDPAGWYWSSTEHGTRYAWDRRFSDGHQLWNLKDFDSSLRCVRG